MKKKQHREDLKRVIFSQEPSDEQIKAIFDDDCEFILRATPGSGKTFTAVRRFLWRRGNWSYSADSGLALLSFTNTAIQEFKNATKELCENNNLSDPNFIGTIDSFAERFILVPFGYLLNGQGKRPHLFYAPRPGDRNNSKFKLIDSQGKPTYAWDIIPPEGKNYRKKIQYGITTMNECWFDKCKSIMDEFIKAGFYTHEHRGYWSYKLISEYPYIGYIIARRFPEIILDEAQDTNIWMMRLLHLLRVGGSKITIVGDPNQCIYDFALASPDTIDKIKEKWSIKTNPLGRSFRCNNTIAQVANGIIGDTTFQGNGTSRNEHSKAFILNINDDDYKSTMELFLNKAKNAGISITKCAVLGRGHSDIAKTKGFPNYFGFTGKTRKLADAVFSRDEDSNYHEAFNDVINILRELYDNEIFWNEYDENPASIKSQKTRIEIWNFIRSSDVLPSLSLYPNEWLKKVRVEIGNLLIKLNVPQNSIKLSTHFRASRKVNLEKPLFNSDSTDLSIRCSTIHGVKGESLDAVLVIGSKGFFDQVIKGVKNQQLSEERRLLYVAVTRAKHLAIIALPKNHFKDNSDFWMKLGFEIIS